MKDDERIWVCSSCSGLEFDLSDENIKVVYKGTRNAVILFEGRAHSLVSTTLAKIKHRRELENKALAYSNYTLYRKKDDDEEVVTDPEAADG